MKENVLNLFVISVSVLLSALLAGQVHAAPWQLDAQQSEGVELLPHQHQSEEQIALGKSLSFELEPFGRAVFNQTTLIAEANKTQIAGKAAQQNFQELVCDSTRDQPVSINLNQAGGKPVFLASLSKMDKTAAVSCQPRGDKRFVCREDEKKVVAFCSMSTRLASLDSSSVSKTTSLSMRSSLFNLQYKPDIISGVKMIRQQLGQCKGFEAVRGQIEAEWEIEPDGSVSGVELSLPEQSVVHSCVSQVLQAHQFPKHDFVTQYWVETF